MNSLTVYSALVLVAVIITAGNGQDCYDEHLKINIKRGETIYPEGECLRMSCTDEGKIHPEPCEMGIPPNCKYVDGDVTKKWPECCPYYTC